MGRDKIVAATRSPRPYAVPMYLALASCSKLTGWEVDDEPFHRALAERGVEAPAVVWDDPQVDWTTFDAC